MDVEKFVRHLCRLVLRHQMLVWNYFVNSFYSAQFTQHFFNRLVSSRAVSTSTALSGCFQPGQAKVVLGPTPLDETVQRVGREIGGARKQRVPQTGQLETRICTARENGGPEWILRAYWLCNFLAGGGRVRACG
jgi:hypothetical protein